MKYGISWLFGHVGRENRFEAPYLHRIFFCIFRIEIRAGSKDAMFSIVTLVAFGLILRGIYDYLHDEEECL